MGKDFESWLHQRQPDGQFPNAKSLKLPFEFGMQNASIPGAIPCTNGTHMSGALPSFGFPETSNFKTGQLKEPHGWFYCLPQFRQGSIPDTTLPDKFTPETDFLGKVPPAANKRHGEVNASPPDARSAPKQFLVFDRTGNKTTLILSSMIGNLNKQLNPWNQKSSCYYNVNGGELGYGSSGLHSEPNLTDLDDENETSEMHEDTEDINALLSSDDEDSYSDDGDEASTGRSPSTMTAYEKQDWFNESDDNEDMDEVASSAVPSKRQKLSSSGYEAPSITSTTSSFKVKGSLDYEDDAESSCAGVQPTRCDNVCLLSGNKRERKEKIRETVSLLQTILPGGNSKDAVVVLDEAIDYLKTLKLKAKSLGISGL